MDISKTRLFLYFVVNLLLFNFNWHYNTCSPQMPWIYIQTICSCRFLGGIGRGLQRTDQSPLAIITGNMKHPHSLLRPTSYPPCLIAVLGIRQADKKGEALSLQDGFWGIEWDKSACWWRRRGGGEGGGLMALWDGATAWSITSQQPIPPPCMRTCARVRQSGGMLRMCHQEKKGMWLITAPAKNTYSNVIKSENVSKTTTVA